ncbi:MAG: UbiA family prenyltransferase, partial [Chloroflexota bacterium]|nr:UbiA family prenyltransferase [Chloroflexota bacterium]
MRPRQWTKNSIVLAALVFDERILEGGALSRAIAALFVFCAVSSGIYIINDLRDVDADRLHPRKRHRPIAANLVSPGHAAILAVTLLAAGTLGAYVIRPTFLLVVAGYMLLMVAYSYGLKRLVLIDVFAIA